MKTFISDNVYDQMICDLGEGRPKYNIIYSKKYQFDHKIFKVNKYYSHKSFKI